MNKKSKMIFRFILVLILFGFINQASALLESDLQWAQGVTSQKLFRNEVFTYKDYSIKIVGLPPPVESARYEQKPAQPVELFAGLNISRNGKFVNTIVLIPGESYITSDNELKLEAKEFPSATSTVWLYESYAPWVILEIQPRGIPHLGVTIETDENDYLSSTGTEIIATIKIKNTGSADAFNVDVEVETEIPKKTGELKYHFERLERDETVIKTIKFSPPILNGQKNYRLAVNVTGYDVRDLFYSTESLKNIIVSPEPQQFLSVSKFTADKMYLKDNTMISLVVKNHRNHDINNVTIKDAVPNGFRLIGNHSLNWTVDIPARAEWDYRYLLKPVAPDKNGYLIPAAIVEFKINKESYMLQSSQSKIIVYGPSITLTKQTDAFEIDQGDAVTVKVTAINSGSTPTRVIITDEVPENLTVISGLTALEEFLEAQRQVSFSYIIKIDTPLPVELPPANAEYFELGSEGGKIQAQSQSVIIKKKQPVETIEKEVFPGEPDYVSGSNTATLTVTPTPAPLPVESPPEEMPDNSSEIDNAENSIDEAELNSIFMDTLLDCGNNHYNITRNACDFFWQIK